VCDHGYTESPVQQDGRTEKTGSVIDVAGLCPGRRVVGRLRN